MKLKPLLLFLTGVSLQALPLDYFLITTPAKWIDAKNYCRTHYDDLATVQTADNWYRLTAEAERKGLPVTGWIGLYNRVNDWFWIDVGLSTVKYRVLNSWVSGQPDNFGGKEECVAMDSSGLWLDYQCTELKPFICYDKNVKGFVAVPNRMESWHNSRSYCWSHHFDLAYALNSTEESQLQQMVISQGTSWIGIFRFSWAWANGSNALNLPWRPGYPNNAERANNCGYMNNSLIQDKLCNGKFYFFCHKRYTVKRQAMKLSILGDNSVFDPVTQFVILQQIKQKLKDHGIMREVNVTWKVRADGNIFHKISEGEL